MKPMRLLALWGALMILCVSSALGTVHTITLTNFSISPANTAVTLGDTVKWVIGTGTHNSTSDGSSPKAWSSGTLSGAATFQLILSPTDPTGNYPYRCTIHPGTMRDTLRVSAPPDPPSSQGKKFTILLRDFQIFPQGYVLHRGDTVRWVRSSGTHSSVSDAGSPKSWNSGVLSTLGQTFELPILLSDPLGIYPYGCGVHPTGEQENDALTIVSASTPRELANSIVNNDFDISLDQINPSLAWSEFMAGEMYAVWTDYTTLGSADPTISSAVHRSGGVYIDWRNLGYPNPPSPYAHQFNPTIASFLPGRYDNGGYIAANAAFSGIAYTLTDNAILANVSTGIQAPFSDSTPVATVATSSSSDSSWNDYPTIMSDDWTANPDSTKGTAHVAWVQLVDGGTGDANGDGNVFNDASDGYRILYSYTSTASGSPAFAFPTFAPVETVYTGTSVNLNPGFHKPSIDVVGPNGTSLIPGGGVYIAWLDPSGTVYIDAAKAPGGAWGQLTGGSGPVSVASFTPLPQTLDGDVEASSTVSLSVDNSGGTYGGTIYLTWSDYSNGDADVYFSSSNAGGAPGTWTTPVRVNGDAVSNGKDQWMPSVKAAPPVRNEINIVFYDRRMDAANQKAEVWGAVSTNGGATWQEGLVSGAGPKVITSTITHSMPTRIYFGDYLGQDFNALNGYGAIWNDSHLGTDQDVWFESNVVFDVDGDGLTPPNDNCPFVANANQLDVDGDGVGDACDNCVNTPNANQQNSDGDSFGNACDLCPNNASTNADTDGDNVGNECDNCVGVSNQSQQDTDNDQIGDACDICPNTPNFGNPDADGDGIQDSCDNCMTKFNPNQEDGDADFVGDSCDNCPAVANTNQMNTDGDSLGNACDACPTIPNPCPTSCCVPPTRGNVNGIGGVTVTDLTYLVAYLFNGGTPPPCEAEANVNGIGTVSVTDLVYLVNFLFNGGAAPAACP